MQVFFIISGIVLPLSMIHSGYNISNWGKFMWKRFIRLEPAYIVAVIIALFYLFIRRFVPSSASDDLMLSGKELALHVGYLVPFVDDARWAVTSLWTLSVEFQYYIFLSLAFPLALHGKWSRWLFYGVLIFPFILPIGSFFPAHAALFMLGITYALWYGKIIKTKEYLIVTALAIAVAISVHTGAQVIAALATLCVIHFAKDYHNKNLGFLGAISYSLYLVHQSTGIPVINFLSHRVTSGLGKTGVILIGFAISIGCAYFLYRLVELPSLRWSKRVRYQ